MRTSEETPTFSSSLAAFVLTHVGDSLSTHQTVSSTLSAVVGPRRSGREHCVVGVQYRPHHPSPLDTALIGAHYPGRIDRSSSPARSRQVPLYQGRGPYAHCLVRGLGCWESLRARPTPCSGQARRRQYSITAELQKRGNGEVGETTAR